MQIKINYGPLQKLSEQFRVRRRQAADMVAPVALQDTRTAVAKKTIGDLLYTVVDQTAPGVFEINVAARMLPGKSPRIGQVHYPSGVVKPVPLRATPPADIARFRAEGTGTYKNGQLIRPLMASVLLIGIPYSPLDQAYITDGRQDYIMRPWSKGQRRDAYPSRAAKLIREHIMLLIGNKLGGTR